MNEEKHELAGLGGWLILVGFGLVFGPVRLAATYVPMFYGILTDGTWELLTSTTSDSYIPNMGALLIFEMIVNSLFLLLSGLLLYLFFSKKRLFPKLYIAYTLISLTLLIVDAYATNYLFPDMPVWDQATLIELARGLPALLIWVPYMLLSERVKRTFVD